MVNCHFSFVISRQSRSVIRQRFDTDTSRERSGHLALREVDYGDRAISMVRDQGGFSVGGISDAKGLLPDRDRFLRRMQVTRIEDVRQRIHVVRSDQYGSVGRVARPKRTNGVLLDNDG